MSLFGTNKKSETESYDRSWLILTAITANDLQKKVDRYIEHGYSPVFASYNDTGIIGIQGYTRYSMIVQK